MSYFHVCTLEEIEESNRQIKDWFLNILCDEERNIIYHSFVKVLKERSCCHEMKDYAFYDLEQKLKNPGQHCKHCSYSETEAQVNARKALTNEDTY
jgi:hypothetical protein